MLVVIWVILILLGLLFHKSKRLFLVQAIFSILLMGLSSGTADYYLYQDIYNNIIRNPASLFSGNWLFNWFYFIFGVLTSYQFAIFMTSVIGTILLYMAIIYYTDAISLVFSLYLIAPFTIDATQQRNFLAMAIWLVFTRFLYEAYSQKKNRRIRNINLIKYCVGVFLATGVHTAFAVTLLFILVVFFDFKKLLIMVVGFNMVVLLSVTTYLEMIMQWVKELLQDREHYNFLKMIYSKYIAYSISFNQGATMARIRITVVFFLMILVLTILARFLKKKCIYPQGYVLLDYAMKLNLVFMLCMPLMFFSMEFYRVQRNLLIIDFIAVQAFIKEKSTIDYKIRIGDLVLGLGTVVLAGYYLFFDSLYWNFDSVFEPLFRL